MFTTPSPFANNNGATSSTSSSSTVVVPNSNSNSSTTTTTTTTTTVTTTTSEIWTPMDCCLCATLTESGLLDRSIIPTEVELYTIVSTYINNNSKCTIELRGPERNSTNTNTNDDIFALMVPYTIDNTIDTTKQSINYYYKTTFPFQMIITTHRIVFIRDDFNNTNNTNTNTNDSNTPHQQRRRRCREARYIHMSNIFSTTTETQYFKSPKIILSTTIGEILFAFFKGNNNSNSNPIKVRDECYNYIQTSFNMKQWDIDEERIRQNDIQRKIITQHKVGVDAILSSSQQRHLQAQQITNRAFDTKQSTSTSTTISTTTTTKNKEVHLELFLQEATELVHVIQKYVATIDRSMMSNSSSSSENDDTDKLIHMLQDMGMTSILTKSNNNTNTTNKKKKTNDTYDTYDTIYYDTIARQIVDLILPKLQRYTIPIISLTDVYCYYNRSRAGTGQLLSPQDVVYAVQRLQSLHLPLQLYIFPTTTTTNSNASSNTNDTTTTNNNTNTTTTIHHPLMVLQDPKRINIDILTKTFLQMCYENELEYYNNHPSTDQKQKKKKKYYGYITAVSVSQKCHIPTILALEQLRMVEQQYNITSNNNNINNNNDRHTNNTTSTPSIPPLVRDETLEVIRFYKNEFFLN